jgi:hypothetical protein
VNRFAREYQNTMASATGESTKQMVPSFQVAATNATDATVMNSRASPRVMSPRGNSRPAVLGLSASCDASTSRLNAMAALRAATIATTIHTSLRAAGANVQSPPSCSARSAPVSANGSAKTE